MIFTQEQINEIKQRLALSGSKDLQLPLANLPLSGEETIALVQQGENKRVSIEEFYEEFSQYIDGSERVDFFNVSRYAQRVTGADESVALTLNEAVVLCPEDVRRGGQVLTFINREGNWMLWQYKGVDASHWEDTSMMWVSLESGHTQEILNIAQEAKDIAQNTAQSASSMENIVGVLKEQGEQEIATVLEHEARIEHNEQDIAKLQEQLGLLLRQAE